MAATGQSVKIDLPRGLKNVAVAPGGLKDSAVVVSVPTDDQFYVGNDRVQSEELGAKIRQSLKSQERNRVVYIASGADVEYEIVVQVLNTIREQEVGLIGLVVESGTSENSIPGTFLVEVPMSAIADDDISKLKPEPSDAGRLRFAGSKVKAQQRSRAQAESSLL